MSRRYFGVSSDLCYTEGTKMTVTSWNHSEQSTHNYKPDTSSGPTLHSIHISDIQSRSDPDDFQAECSYCIMYAVRSLRILLGAFSYSRVRFVDKLWETPVCYMIPQNTFWIASADATSTVITES